MKFMTILAFAFVLSCGGSGGSDFGPSSGLPRTATIGSLSPSEARTLCTWTNGKQGGYGHTVTCPDGSQQGTDPDEASEGREREPAAPFDELET